MANNINIDTTDLDAHIRNVRFSASELLHIAGAGAAVLVNGMRMRVPKKTHATEISTRSHIIKSTSTYVEDEVGPETEYAPNIEYGRRDMPNYPKQPFVRPTADADLPQVVSAISHAYKAYLDSTWRT